MKITAFETTGNTSKLAYEVDGEKRTILYTVNGDGTVPFEYQSGGAGTTKETYIRRQRGGPGLRTPKNPARRQMC